MIDLIYVGGTIGFFALMLWYVHVCERLGHSASAEIAASEERQS